MAFTNLFSKLASFDEDARNPDGPGFTFRNRTENRGGTRKRKTQDEQHGSYTKKSCDQFQKTSASHAFGGSYSPAKRHQKQSAGNYCSAGRAKGGRTNQRSNPDHINKQSCNGQNYKSKKNNGKMTQKTQNNKQRYRDRIITEDKPRFMTQEFKDQNALLVDGRLLCRHFLYGRCIKEDSCQLLHVQGYNDMIKEACKFYIQGSCQKGDGCIYMHKSFPCKFFHRKGKCSQEESCRFSHDALNNVTEKLLDEVLRQEKEYNEVRKEEKEEETEANQDPDALTEPLRPTFYNSTDTVKETDPLQSESSVPDLAEPHVSPTDDPDHQEPVCYSVEAVLGPQLSRTLSSFSKTPGSQESSDKTESSSNQSEAPYSVEVVLRSYKPVLNTKPSLASLHDPRTVSGADSQNKTSQNDHDLVNSFQEIKSKSLLSSGVNVNVTSDTSSDLNVQRAATSSQGVEPCLVSEAEQSRTEGGTDQLAGTTPSTRRTFPPKHPGLPKPSSSSDVDEFTGRAAASVAPVGKSLASNVGVHRFAAKQLAEILQNSKKKHSTHEPPASTIVQKSRRTSNQVGLGEAQRPFVRRSADLLAGRAAPSAGSEGLLKPECSAFLSSDQSSQTSRSAQTASALESVSSGLRAEDRQTPLRQTSLTPWGQKTDDAAAKQTATPGSEPPSGQVEPPPPDVSAPRATSSSVLKTLFLHLKPFQEDRGHQLRPAATVAPLGQTELSSVYSADRLQSSATSGETETRGAEERKQWNGRKQNDLSTEKTSLPRTDLRSQTLQSEDPGRSSVVRPGPTEPQATHRFPFEAATRHRGPGAKPTSEEGAAVSRNAAVTPLRDLFKTLGAFSPTM